MRFKFGVVLFLLLWAVPGSLAGQGGDAARRIEAAKQRVSAAGIPVTLLESKVAEGRAKGVPLERIAAVVEARAAALVRAQAVIGRLDPPVSSADLSVGADALQAGVSEGALRAVAEAAPLAQRAVAIAVLMQLIGHGHPPAEAVRQVQAAIAEGPDALRTLPSRIQRQRAPPEARGSPRSTPDRSAGRTRQAR